MKRHTEHVLVIVAVAVVIAIGLGLFVYSGIYNIGADDHHTKPVFAVLQTLRNRSIHVRSDDIKVPNLNDPQLILKGAGQYAAMCTGCHLRPGQENSELRKGMYPQPPNLSKVHVDPRDAFWVIKHGIKMSAMPAWGLDGSHDDPTIWSMVAFIEKLPGMTPAQYKTIVAKAPPDEDMDMDDGGGHSHSHGGAADDKDAHGDADMKGMEMSGEAGHSHDAAAEDGHDHAATTAPAVEAPLSLDGMKPKAAPEAEAVAQAFHTALQHGDRTAALALLAPEATISEGGHTQSRDDYADGHLGEDIAFLKTARITPVSLGSMPMGNTALVGSVSDIQTTIKGKPATLRSTELLNLKKDGKDWKIVSVRWQSAPVSGE
jgi:hypothetical protein